MAVVELQDMNLANRMNKDMAEYNFEPTDEEFKELVQLAMKR